MNSSRPFVAVLFTRSLTGYALALAFAFATPIYKDSSIRSAIDRLSIDYRSGRQVTIVSYKIKSEGERGRGDVITLTYRNGRATASYSRP